MRSVGLELKNQSVWQRDFRISILWGAVLLLFSLVVNYFANIYASERVSLPVTDIILSNVRVFDVDTIVLYGAALVILFVGWLQIRNPQTVPFVLKAHALFIVIRAIFVTLTHIGPFYPHVVIESNLVLRAFGLGAADLFFSGHTGAPFLMALIYWNNKKLRLVFLLVSAIFGGSMLLGHLHYSIDVFAAFFITHTIFHIAKKWFPQDWQLANRESNLEGRK